MASELIPLLYAFENSSKCVKISLISDSLSEWLKGLRTIVSYLIADINIVIFAK